MRVVEGRPDLGETGTSTSTDESGGVGIGTETSTLIDKSRGWTGWMPFLVKWELLTRIEQDLTSEFRFSWE
jgi:hypothetical protein